MALPLTTDPGTAPPWLRPKTLPGYSTLPMQTDPATDPGAGQMGGNLGITPGAPLQVDPGEPMTGSVGGNLGLPNYNTPTGSPVFGGAALSLAGLDSPSAAPAALASGPNYNTPSGLPTGGGMPAWNAGMLASNGTSVPGSPGSVAPPSSFEAFLADLPGISTDFSADAKHASDDAYKQATQYFDQDFTRDNSALEAKLTAQGFAPGSEAFTNEMEKQKRGQNSARENAALQSQQIGFSQAGDLLSRALAARGAMYGERSDNANRALTARGQDKGVEQAGIGASASMANAATSADAAKYGDDVSGSVALRRLGLDQSNSDYQNLLSLIAASRGGVNMPNFGTPAPLDVTGANSVAASNANAAANRTAANNSIFAQLGGAALGSFLRG